LKKKIGLIGFGFVGKYVYQKAIKENFFDVGFIYDENIPNVAEIKSSSVLESVKQITDCMVDMIVEVASPIALKSMGKKIIEHADVMPFSMTAFSDEDFFNDLKKRAADKKHRIIIPHGAIIGLDGIFDARDLIEHLTIISTKPAKKFGYKDGEIKDKVKIYEGNTFNACKKFPNVVNVHAAVAISGIGFKNTKSVIIADPDTNAFTHHIEVIGKGIKWNIDMESPAIGESAGAYPCESVYQSIKRICLNQDELVLC